MSNTGHYVLCPFYVSSKNLSITCEDIYRRHDSKSDKHKWMRTYCDRAWESCPYARDLLSIYEKGENVDQALDKQRLKELQTEQRRLMSRIGILEKKEERFKDKIQELRDQITTYRTREYAVSEAVTNVASMYEGYISFLLTELGRDKLDILEYEKWSENKEFRLLATKREDGGRPIEFRNEVRTVEKG